MTEAVGAALAAVLNSLWQTAVLAAAAWIALRFMPRVNAATRHLIWWAVLALLVLLPVVGHSIRVLPPRAQPVVASTVPDPVEEPPAIAASPSPALPKAPLAFDPGNWPARIFAAWCFIALLQLARVVWSYVWLRGLKRRASLADPDLRRNFDAWSMSCAVGRPARLLVSTEIASPIAVGFRQPAVILPASLVADFKDVDLDHVLLHELAHLARRDDWTNLAARLAAAVLAVHPVAAWVLQRIEREREIACDDWVVSMTGQPRPYAASLTRLFELCLARRRMLLASGMAERASHLGDRIQALLHRRGDLTARVSVTRLVLGSLALAALVIAFAQAPNWIAFAQDRPSPAASAPAVPPDAPAPPAAPSAPAPEAPAAPTPQSASRAAPAPQTAAAPPAPQAAPQGSFLAALVAAGYGNLTVDQIVELKTSGVSPAFLTGISQAGWGKLSPEQLITLCHRGVTPQYVAQMHSAGLKDLTFQDVISLATFGVQPDKVRQIHALGFGPYTAKDIIQFATRGLNLDLFRALKDYGYANPDPREIVEAQTFGLSARDLREAKQYGSSLTLKQIIKLKMAGVL